MDAADNKPKHTIGEILRRWGPEYSRTHPVPEHKRRVMVDLARCRSALLGGHLEKCDACGHERPVYNSCGNRHCPNCQGKLARKWLAKRLADVLNTPYFHCVFTIPDGLNILVPRNEYAFYSLLFRAVSQTLRHFARRHLGGQLGAVAVLHTWGQLLWLHPHIHCIVTGGALSADGELWGASGRRFLFDVHALSADFRDRFCRLLRREKLWLAGEAAALAEPGALETLIAAQQQRDWVVYIKKPESGPAQILEYLSRYTHRVAIANRRILEVGDDGTVTLEYKDWRERDAGGNPTPKTMELPAVELIGRFLRHILPRGFRKIRTYGLLAGKNKAEKMAAARELLGPVPELHSAPAAEPFDPAALLRCPACGQGTMRLYRYLYPERSPPVVVAWTDSLRTRAA